MKVRDTSSSVTPTHARVEEAVAAIVSSVRVELA